MLDSMLQRSAPATALLATAILLGACADAPAPDAEAPVPSTVRLVDLAADATVEGSPTTGTDGAIGTWRFDTADAAAWDGVHVADLGLRDGVLAGRTTGDDSAIGVHWGGPADPQDELHEVEVRMSVSAGTQFWLRLVPGETMPPLEQIAAQPKDIVWHVQSLTSPLVADGTMRTYTLRYPATISAAEMANVVIRPSDVAGAEFAIESVRVITRRAHLASIPAGLSWQGLSEIYHETLVGRTPETLVFDVELPERPQLHLSVGTVEGEPVTFRVHAGMPDGDSEVVFEQQVETPMTWNDAAVDLDRFAGQRVALRLEATAADPGRLAFWGSPSIYSRHADDHEGPRGTIFVVADTLGAQYLSIHGYDRETAPTLVRLAEEGVHFAGAQAEATWTKPSVTSMLTSLFPSTHGVLEFEGRLPATATTLAESFRDAGYATLSMSSVYFTGRFSNLHQGFEELHEAASLEVQPSSMTASAYVDRLLPWLDQHRDVPFFVFLHLYDPHFPYEKPPYAEKWVDPAGLEEHRRVHGAVRQFIDDPLMRAIGMPTREQLLQAEADPDAFAAVWQGWYDGSVLGTDDQLARLVGHLDSTGLADDVVVAIGSDHGADFVMV